MRINSVYVLGWTIFHQLLLARAQTPPDNPLDDTQHPSPPDNPLTDTQYPTPPDNPLTDTQHPTPPDNPLTDTQQPTPPDNPLSAMEIYLVSPPFSDEVIALRQKLLSPPVLAQLNRANP